MDRSEYFKKYREENRDKLREGKKKYREENIDKLRERNRKYYHENKDRNREGKKKYREENRDKIREGRKKYREENIDKLRELDRKYYAENRDKLREGRNKKYKKDLNFKLRAIISVRMRQALKRNNTKKTSKSAELLGCTVKEAREHIEKQFKEGMTWENYGHNTWHIDHIMPCASFDLTDPEQQKKCFHYTNLQPLWAHENMSKGAKIL